MLLTDIITELIREIGQPYTIIDFIDKLIYHYPNTLVMILEIVDDATTSQSG